MKNLKQQFCCLLTCAAALLGSTPAAACGSPVVYDNGAPNHLSGNNLGFARQAEDFTLCSMTTVTDVHFWSLEADNSYRGSISWAILSNAAGSPGATTLASGTQSAVTRTSLGTVLGLTEYRNDFDLNMPLALGAGRYWLVLHNGSFSNLGDPNEFLWETTANNGSYRGFEAFDVPPTWTSNFNEHAFQIPAVPEPGEAAMLLAGIGVLAWLRRRAARRLLLAPLMLSAGAAFAQSAQQIELTLPAADTSPALTAMAQEQLRGIAPAARVQLPRLKAVPQASARDPFGMEQQAGVPYSALQTGSATPPMPQVNTGGTRLNFEGVGATNSAPSDANGAVGETQYVQWVNTSLAVYRKSDGALQLGPIPGNAVFAGMTGSAGADACRLSNNGDPIAQYDKLAKRWILTQFAWAPGTTETGPYFQCIAVSTSSDATGSYYRYVLETRSASGGIIFPDYPKVGVWPDAYYFTWVLFDTALGGFRGPRACGFDRAAMLAGAATAVRCYDFGTAFGVILPSDLDGTTAPPAGSPNYLMSLDFGEDGSGDHLFLWRFSFTSSSISGAIPVPVAPFVIACPSSFGGACVHQPAPGELLDTLGDRLMYRLAYRNFGNREALVVNHSVQQPGAATDGPVGVRWYEIRNPGGAVAVYQQGTYAPDHNSRWMGSIAMDRMGNIALGYSISGDSTPPGIRYTGRLRSEPLGRLEAEGVIVNGSGVQVDTFNRWGDYSAMAVDPVRDCSFWYTQQYIATTGRFNWHTRIAAFQFGNCR